jgi:glycosyltransferase involved in cell wall biosynthesis
MRIAYLAPEYPAVSHSFVRREIQALERRNIEIVRFSLRGWNAELVDKQDLRERERTRYVLRGGIFPLSLAVLHMLFTRPMRFLRALMLTIRIGRSSDRALPLHLIYLAEACRMVPWLRGIPHLHAHFGTNAAEVAMLAEVLGGPRWSFTSHGTVDADLAQLVGLPEKLRRCAFAVAISSFGRTQLSQLAGCHHASKVHVVHCGLEPAFYAIPAHAIPAAPRLVCVGRLSEPKGQRLLLEAAARLVARGMPLELTFAGDGELRPELETLISAHNLQAQVRITGWIGGEQVREEILAARALVLASYSEGLPVVIMEAMALRRPVISTRLGGIPELVIPGENGWLIPAGDVEELVKAMRACLEASPAELMQMGEAAHARALARHDVDVEAAKLDRLFREAIEAAHRS